MTPDLAPERVLAGRRVLVTGATGFLGSHCVGRLSGVASVVATGRRAGRLGQVCADDRAEALALDLAEASAVDRLVAAEPDVIVHAAALASPWGRPDAFHRSNVVATEQILAAAAALAVPVVYVSTPALYMGCGTSLDIGEDVPLPDGAPNDYIATKRAAEDAVRAHVGAGRGSALILRPQALVGAGDTTIAPRLLRVARSGLLPLIGGGDAVLDLTHVENAAEAVARAAASVVADPRSDAAPVFNITNGEPSTIRDLLARFADAYRAAHPERRPLRPVRLPSRPLLAAAGGLEALSRRTGFWEPPITRYSVSLLGETRTLRIERARRELGYDPSEHPLDSAFVEFFAAAGTTRLP